MSDLSRRDTLKLARFGAFLATGLCLGAEVHAKGKENEEAVEPLAKGAILIKFYQSPEGEPELVQTIECDGSVFGNPLEADTAITIKFANAGSLKSMKEHNSVAFTVKLNGAGNGRLMQSAKAIKLSQGSRGLIYD